MAQLHRRVASGTAPRLSPPRADKEWTISPPSQKRYGLSSYSGRKQLTRQALVWLGSVLIFWLLARSFGQTWTFPISHLPRTSYAVDVPLPPGILPKVSHQGVYPLDDLNSAKLARADSGTLILISQDTAKAAIEQLLCDVLSVHKLHSHDTSGPHRPLLTQHITVGFVATPNVQSRINGLGDSLRRLAAEPRCGASNVTSDAGVRPLPSISLTHFDYYRFPSAMDELRPRAVLSTLDANLDKDYQHLVRYRQDVWISLGQDDLQHSGWILTLPNRAIKAWHVPTFKLLVITKDRPASLQRLRKSLDTAQFFGDEVSLQISVEGSADEETLKLVREWTNPDSEAGGNWQHGNSNVNFRFQEAGLMSNVLEAWWPSSDHEYALFFEDDIEASPFFYAWAKWATLYYRYGPDLHSPAVKHMYGISLIQQKTSELNKRTGRILWDASSILREQTDIPIDPSTPYLSQVPSSWGAVYFPEIWREFHDYIQIRYSEAYWPLESKKYIVSPSVVSDGWKTSWKRFLIELVYLRGYTMLYPNYPDFASLSTNHVELGEHIDEAKQQSLRRLQELPLMTENRLLALPHRVLPPQATLPTFDLWGELAPSAHAVAARGHQRRSELWKCPTGSALNDTYRAEELFRC